MNLLKIQLAQAEKLYHNKNLECAHMNELLKEHTDAMQTYLLKVLCCKLSLNRILQMNRLEERVLLCMQSNARTMFSSFLMSLITVLLSSKWRFIMWNSLHLVFAVIILCFTTVLDFCRKLSGSTTLSMTKRSKSHLAMIGKQLSSFALDFQLQNSFDSANASDSETEAASATDSVMEEDNQELQEDDYVTPVDSDSEFK